MRDGLGVPLSIGDTSKWNLPDVSGSGRLRAGWVVAVAWRVRVRIDETAGSPCGAGSRSAPSTAPSTNARRRPADIVWQFDFVGNVDVMWETPVFGPLLRGIASFARLILHDPRGTGLSSRNVPPPNLETRAADLRAILDAVGSERPVLAGLIESGAANAPFAATSPIASNPSCGGVPRREASGVRTTRGAGGPEYVAVNERELEHWGTLEGARIWAEGESIYGHVFTEEEIRAQAKLSRHTASFEEYPPLGA